MAQDEFENIRVISEEIESLSKGLTDLQGQVSAITVDRKYYSQSTNKDIDLIKGRIDALQVQSANLEQEVKTSLEKLENKIEKVDEKLNSQLQAQDDDIQSMREDRSDWTKQLLLALVSGFLGWVFSKM